MIYTVDMTAPSAIQFAPSSLIDEVAQNIRTILATPLGSAPFARDIGLDYSLIDEPAPIAEARLIGAITTAIAAQEPRAIVTDVIVKPVAGDAWTGTLPAVVRFRVSEGVA
ncbi:GPW/gp25 family protein [Cohnella nanjingensis]|uniref:GPW/gp25 family protein n=1 Tax=Cohnella nanjingensis TaxID=1387779 RepID=A0A7X0VEA0_9BACL|nr:GPW/gp25 family protein [Cohnella nanjingensis]MBB6670511.1 GPW/gp25 family protein [Cohnella nanjingensis]